jgi:hypothetical protein
MILYDNIKIEWLEPKNMEIEVSKKFIPIKANIETKRKGSLIKKICLCAGDDLIESIYPINKTSYEFVDTFNLLASSNESKVLYLKVEDDLGFIYSKKLTVKYTGTSDTTIVLSNKEGDYVNTVTNGGNDDDTSIPPRNDSPQNHDTIKIEPENQLKKDSSNSSWDFTVVVVAIITGICAVIVALINKDSKKDKKKRHKKQIV